MDSTAINRVTTALKTMLDAALEADSGSSESVFVGPLDDTGNTGFKMHLFLYRICVNADLRNSEHVVPASQPQLPSIIHRGALPLDLYYLVTAGTRNTGGELTDLSLLGRVMQVLNDSPNLVGLPVQNEIARVTLDPVGSEEMSRIWALFPTANYRTSVVYLVTPVWIDPAGPTVVGAPVVEEPHAVGHLG